MKKYTKKDLVADLKALGINEGDLLNVKISYKSIGLVEGGAKTVVDALIEAVGSNGTIFSDSFVRSFPYLKLLFFPNKCIVNNTTPTYAGAIASVMTKHKDAKRSPHPIQKFTAIGLHSDLVLKHTAESKPYSLLYELSQAGGKNLRIGPKEKVTGVGTTHCAVELLKLKQNIVKKGVCYINNEKKVQKFYSHWPTTCSTAYNNLIPKYRQLGGIINEGFVGDSEAILSDMNKTLEIEQTLGKQNPNFLLCTDPGCYKCQLNWEFSQGSLCKVLYTNLKRKKFKRMALILFMAITQKNYQPKH